MKNSGVDWIGEIPAHWEIRRLKDIANFYTGNSLNESEKEIYGENPDILHSIFIADTSRVVRILIAEKTYDSRGRRKMTLSNYTPTYDLFDLYNSTLDFQNDKWIRISLLNSDSRLFRIRRLMRLLFRYKTNSNTPPTKHDA